MATDITGVDLSAHVEYNPKKLAVLGKRYTTARQKVTEIQQEIVPLVIAGALAGAPQKVLATLAGVTRPVIHKIEANAGITRSHGGWTITTSEGVVREHEVEPDEDDPL